MKHGITLRAIIKPIRDKKVGTHGVSSGSGKTKYVKSIPKAEMKNVIIELEADMREATELLDFERVIFLRGRIGELGKRLGE